MNAKVQILNQLANTKLDGQKTAEALGGLIRKKFDQTPNEDSETLFAMLSLAWKYQVPQFDEMLNDSISISL